MKILRKLISYFLVFLVGFWLAMAGILNGTKAGEIIEGIVDYFPNRNQVNRIIQLPVSEEIKDESQENTDINIDEDTETTHDEVDYELVESTIVELVNELREDKDLTPLTINEELKAGAIVRAKETEESFSHTRPGGLESHTVLKEEGSIYKYKIFGENLAMGTYYLDEEEMAELLFEGWVDSEGHYENMIQPQYNETGVGVHYDGEMLYITQLFGSQL